MMTNETPERVHQAEERREFRQLLDASSIGPLADNTQRRMVQCATCVNDRCGDVDCDAPASCACTCVADKETLAGELAALLDRCGIWRSDDDPLEMARSLYRSGWRRES